MIRKTQIKKFIQSFSKVGIASEILNSCFFDSEHGIIEKDRYETLFTDVEEAFNLRCYQLSGGMLDAELAEVESNLFALTTEDRIIYIKDLIRSFKDVAFYFDNPVYVQHPVLCKRTENIYNFMQDYGSYEDSYPNFSIPQQYVCECYWALNLFASDLDAKLLEFNLDLQELQWSIGIFIWRDRDFDSLKEAGFDVSDLENNDWLIHAFKRGLSYDNLKNQNTNETIVKESVILALRSVFDGVIWKKEPDLSDKDFLKYWTPQAKINSLPVFENKKKHFLYLYFTFLNPNLLPQSSQGRFKISDNISKNTFGINHIRVARKRCFKLSLDDRNAIKKKYDSMVVHGLERSKVTKG